ncbi:MAG: FkbM family methyltransferase [Deltaproteobacteria bacterium]|nr:MAG: FkbM family methyltransferase [Deltaproteobacteria bacterium]
MSNRFSSYFKKKLIGKKNNLVSMEEPYEVMKRLLKGLKITDVVDAGASNGRISRRLLRKFPSASVYGFEPNPLYRETLRQFAADNPRFLPQFMALSDHEGLVDLHITESPGSTSLFEPGKHLKDLDPKGAEVKHIEKVKVVTLDNWAAKSGNIDVQVIKFDIQGGELLALRGGTGLLRTSILLIYTEVLFNPLYENGAIFYEIDRFLRKFEFILYDIYRPKYKPNGLLMWGSALFLKAKKLNL